MIIWSGGVGLLTIFSIVGIKSSETVQHMQPLDNSIMFSGAQLLFMHSFNISASTPKSPNSLIINAMFALDFFTIFSINVVLPAPRKPVNIVVGIFFKLFIFYFIFCPYPAITNITLSAIFAIA